ncbi:MAG: universal stress protein [Sandaracinaceae bacterium]
MPRIERVLCPVDFSPGSERALAYAVFLRRQLGAEVHVLHVYQLPVYALPDGALLPGPEFTVRLQDDSNKALQEMLDQHPDEELDGHLVEGVPHAEIIRRAKELDCDLIVMGTHGRTGLERLLLGSVAERVVRTSEVPVLTVPLTGETSDDASDGDG